MGFMFRLAVRTVAAAMLAGAAVLAHAEGFSADYSLNGLALQQGGHNWFGQFGLAQGPVNPLLHSGTNDIMNVAGGYRFSNGQSLSLQLSRGRQGQRLGLAVNYDWPRYFVRFSYDPQGLTLSPQDSLRFSAGVRF